MISPLNIHPPKNWQDFETLCLKVWGEIWDARHEIEFNSDNSQGQNGVDIYAPVHEGRQYYGIQCKNKKLNLIDGQKNRITVADIQCEIEKAKSFRPALAKLVIATSLQKDQKIEEFVRIESSKNVESGLFQIQICFWDFFERKIPEFKNINDWYLKNEGFVRDYSVEVTFKNLEKVIELCPKFQRNINRHILHHDKPRSEKKNTITEITINNQSLSEYAKAFKLQNQVINDIHTIEWVQLCWLQLRIKNNGQAVLEDLKLKLHFEGDFISVGASKPSIFNYSTFKSNVKEYKNSTTDLLVKPEEKILVQNDSFITNDIYLEPHIGKKCKIDLYWELLSRDYSCTGVLMILINPKYYTVQNTIYVFNEKDVQTTETITLVKRRGMVGLGGPNFFDKESDFSFQ